MSDDFWMVCFGEHYGSLIAEHKAGKIPVDKIVELVGFSPEPVRVHLKSSSKVPLVDHIEWITFQKPSGVKRGHIIASPGFIRAHRKFTGYYYPLKKYRSPDFVIYDEGNIEIHSIKLPCRINISGGTIDRSDIQVDWDEWIAIHEDWTFNIVATNGVIGSGIVTKAGELDERAD